MALEAPACFVAVQFGRFLNGFAGHDMDCYRVLKLANNGKSDSTESIKPA
jgi:hypothetical protein